MESTDSTVTKKSWQISPRHMEVLVGERPAINTFDAMMSSELIQLNLEGFNSHASSKIKDALAFEGRAMKVLKERFYQANPEAEKQVLRIIPALKAFFKSDYLAHLKSPKSWMEEFELVFEESIEKHIQDVSNIEEHVKNMFLPNMNRDLFHTEDQWNLAMKNLLDVLMRFRYTLSGFDVWNEINTIWILVHKEFLPFEGPLELK